MADVNNFLNIDYTFYGNSHSSHESQLTDEIIAMGLAKYLRQVYSNWGGKWVNMDVLGREVVTHDFFHTAEIPPSRFYRIFKDETRKNKFLSYLKEHNVKATLEKYGCSITLVDLDHPNNKHS